MLLVRTITSVSYDALHQAFQSAHDIAAHLFRGGAVHMNGKKNRQLLVVHCCGSYDKLHDVMHDWSAAWRDTGLLVREKREKERQERHERHERHEQHKKKEVEVAPRLDIIILSYVAHHHPYSTSERKTLESMFSNSNDDVMLILFECLARTTMSNRLRDGDHFHDKIPPPLMSILCGLLSDTQDRTTVRSILESGRTLMTSGRSDVIANTECGVDPAHTQTLLTTRGSVSPRVRPRLNGAWGRVLKRGSALRKFSKDCC